MAEITLDIKTGPDFGYIDITVPNEDGTYTWALHIHGYQDTYSNIPNACSNSLLKVESRGGPWPAKTYYVAVDPKPGFRYLIPISDTIKVPEFTPVKIENFLKFVGWQPGIGSGHSYGWDLLTDYIAWSGRTFDFQALIDVAGYNDNVAKNASGTPDPLVNLKPIPKLDAPTLFWHSEIDNRVSYKYTDGYIASFASVGNTIQKRLEKSGSHDIGRLVMNGARANETFDWIKQQIKPVTPQPQPDQVYPAFYNATGKYFFIVVDGVTVKV